MGLKKWIQKEIESRIMDPVEDGFKEMDTVGDGLKKRIQYKMGKKVRIQ